MTTFTFRSIFAAAALAVLAPGAAFACPTPHPSATKARFERTHQQSSATVRAADSAPAAMTHATRSLLPFAPRSDAWMHWDGNENEG
ncbi:hypothetical protein JOD31_002586 [Methylopila capsulata]|nr:hypothetical protein [Methylopila capsulata]MBM7852344.1 hypothetical protein [Methylopila capsulata]